MQSPYVKGIDPKVFEKIQIESSFLDGKNESHILFDFEPELDDSVLVDKSAERSFDGIGTKINLSSVREAHKQKMRRISFLRDLALHFFPHFIAGRMPETVIRFDGGHDTLADFIEDKIGDPFTEEISVDFEGEKQPLEMTHIYVEGLISTSLKNSIMLTAHHRLVGEPIDIANKFALGSLEDGRSYVGVVKGAFLDQRVDQERVSLRLTEDQQDTLHDAILDAAERFLADHIDTVRNEQKRTVKSLLQEHPQLSAKVKDVSKYVETLPASMTEERIGESLFTLLYRDERKVSKRIREFAEIENLDEASRNEAEKVLAEVSDQAKNRLAELVVKRRQMLTLFRSYLGFQNEDEKSYEYEKAIHEIILPMGEMYSSKDYSAHNLWILDDLLAYYSFFASDKQIRVLSDDSDSAKEPDIIFLNPLGFRREGTNDPVVLVEFKRAGDETVTKNPVDQVLEYVEKLKNKTVRDIAGQVVSEIRDSTPFECYILCDLTEGTRKLLARSLAPQETPDGQGYYGFAPNHKAAIHVISYQKMLHDAELRNEVFFKKLGLIAT